MTIASSQIEKNMVTLDQGGIFMTPKNAGEKHISVKRETAVHVKML